MLDLRLCIKLLIHALESRLCYGGGSPLDFLFVFNLCVRLLVDVATDIRRHKIDVSRRGEGKTYQLVACRCSSRS